MATIRYLVNDVEKSIEFYTKHFGFKLTQKMGPAFAIVSKYDLNVWLSGPQSSAARPTPDGRQPEAGGWNRFVIEVDDIELLVASMKSADIIFRSGKQILAEDPSGNPIELFEPAK